MVSMKSVEEVLRTTERCAIDQSYVDGFISGLRGEVAEVLEGWDRPDQPLRVTKYAIQVMEDCPRKLTATSDFKMTLPLARGRIVDEAARMLSVSTNVPWKSSWEYAVTVPLMEHDTELAQFIEDLDPQHANELRNDVEARCESLKSELGSLSEVDVLPQPSMLANIVNDVWLSAKPDFLTRHPVRAVIELKSGKGRRIVDELAFYALVDLLHSGKVPDVGIGVTLDEPSRVIAMPVEDLLPVARTRVVEALWRLRRIDEAVAAGEPTPATPGEVCGWCPLRETCSDVDDTVPVYEAGASSDQPLEEEPW